MTISPAAENYLYGVMGPYYASLALGRAEHVPSPFEDVERGYFLYPGSGDYSAPRAEAPADYTLDESVDREPDTDYSTRTTGTASKLTGTLGKAQSMLDKAIQGYVDRNLAFPTALNPLTGTVRVSGVSGAISSMMPGVMSGLVGFGYKANMANLTNIGNIAAYGTPGYNLAMLGNQVVGVSPGIFGGPALSGNIPDNLSYEQAQELATAIQSAPMTVYGPARAVAMGLSPQATFGLSAISSPPKGYILTPQGEDPSLPGQLAQDGYGNPIGTNTTTTSVFGLELPNFVTTNMPQDFNYSDFITQPNPEGGFTDFSDLDAFGTQDYGKIGGIIGMEDESLMDSMPNTPTTPTSGSGTNTGGTYGSYGELSGSPHDGTGPGGGASSGGGDYGGGQASRGAAQGGRIEYAPGGNVTDGFVNKDPDSVTEQESIADNRFTSVKEGSFIVNQPTNEKYEGMLDSLVAKAQKKAKKPKDAPMVDVALSDGERHIEPEVVAEIEKMKGKSFLDNLNDKGKPEVKRRQAKYGGGIGLNEGGFLEQGMEVQDIGDDIPMEDYMPVSNELISKITKFASKKPQRNQIKKFIKGLSDEDKLTVLFLTETQSTTDPIESMEAIGEVVQNRIDSDYYDFKDIKTLDDALLKQTKRGAFHFSGLEPSVLFARAKEVKKGVATQGLAKAAAAAQNILNPETEGNRRLPVGTVFYTRKDAPSQWMRESKDLEFSTELGGHEFYRTFITREFP